MTDATATPTILRPNWLGLVDCDVHPRIKSFEDVRPYMTERWWNQLQTYGMRRRHGFVRGHPYPKTAPWDGARRDAWPPGGTAPGSDLAFMQAQHLDANGVDFGIMNPLSAGQDVQDSGLSVALCSAFNDWQLADFSHKDPRLKSSVVVPYEDGEASRAEIRRRAADPNFAQVLLMSRTAEALGRKRYWPIYEAAVEAGLPIGIHVFGYSGYAVTNTGWASYYIEEMAEHETACSALITSMIMEGLFEHLPELKIVMIEAGFAWLPALGWRLDRVWERMRDEVPHVKRPPTEYLREHFWITTQPMEEPERMEHLTDVMEWIGWDRILYASDYPHWDFDDPVAAMPASLSEERKRAIYSGNARAVYGLPEE